MEVFHSRQGVALGTQFASKHCQRDLQDKETYKEGESCSISSNPKEECVGSNIILMSSLKQASHWNSFATDKAFVP